MPGPWYRDATYRKNRAWVLAYATHCGICGGSLLPGQAVEVDHKIPVAMFRKLGLPVDHSLENLQAAHATCNGGGKPPRERPRSRGDIFTR